MCGLHTTSPVIRSILQVKCMWRQSAKYEVNKGKLSDVEGYGVLAVSAKPRGKEEQHTSLLIAFKITKIPATHCPVKTEHNPDLKTLRAKNY